MLEQIEERMAKNKNKITEDLKIKAKSIGNRDNQNKS